MSLEHVLHAFLEAEVFKYTLAVAQFVFSSIVIQLQVLFGRGLGAGPTLHLADLASRRSQPCAGVLLQSPCISPVTLLVGFTAVAWCGCPSRVDAWGTRIQGILEFGSVDCLVCVVHGADDEKVPVEHGLLAHRLAKKPYLKGLWLDM